MLWQQPNLCWSCIIDKMSRLQQENLLGVLYWFMQNMLPRNLAILLTWKNLIWFLFLVTQWQLQKYLDYISKCEGDKITHYTSTPQLVQKVALVDVRFFRGVINWRFFPCFPGEKSANTTTIILTHVSILIHLLTLIWNENPLITIIHCPKNTDINCFSPTKVFRDTILESMCNLQVGRE